MAWALRNSRMNAKRAVSGDMAALPVEGARCNAFGQYVVPRRMKAKPPVRILLSRRGPVRRSFHPVRVAAAPQMRGGLMDRAMRGVTPALSACRGPFAARLL